MKTPPDRLLEAVLSNDHADVSLRLLLQGARRRRIRRRLRSAAFLVALPLFALGAAWWVRFDPGLAPASPPSDSICTMVTTADRPGPHYVPTRPESVNQRESSEGTVRIVSSDRTSLEVIRGEEALLDILSIPAGFIGDGAERHFVLFQSPATSHATVR